MSNHTPGPWEYHTAMNYIGFSVAPLGILPTLAAVERCGDCMTISCFNFPGSIEANARLIAAAPELLDALTNLLDWAENQCGLSGNDECYGAFDCEEIVTASRLLERLKGEVHGC